MKMRKGFISAPLWVYIILSVVTIGSLVIGTSCDSELLKNTGYSLFASLVVAFVIDVGNTITSRKRDEKLFRIITKDYVSAFLRLRESAIGLCDDGDLSENEEHTFKEWLNKAIEKPEEAVSVTRLFTCEEPAQRLRDTVYCRLHFAQPPHIAADAILAYA